MSYTFSCLSHHHACPCREAGHTDETATLRAQLAAKDAEIAKLAKERDEARKNYQFMVERAADQKLDGYRELAQRLNVADQRATAAESALSAARELLRRVRADNHFIYLNVADEVNAALSTVLAQPEAPKTEATRFPPHLPPGQPVRPPRLVRVPHDDQPESPNAAEEKGFRYHCKWHDNGCSCPMEESTPPETK